MIQLKLFTFNAFQENTFVLFDETKECIIIDAGCHEENEKKKLTNFISDNELKPVALVNTHCHIDHILGNRYLVDYYHIPFMADENEKSLLDNALQQGAIFGFSIIPPPPITKFIRGNEKLKFGHSDLDILSVPGHSPGSLAFYSQNDGFVIVGDVLFNGSIGRTDLIGGDYNMLLNSIKQQLMALPSETEVFPGHGPSTSIGHEHDTNPFINS